MLPVAKAILQVNLPGLLLWRSFQTREGDRLYFSYRSKINIRSRTMSRIGDTWHVSMDGMLQRPMTMMGREWLARRDAGQACEIWAVNGGVDELWGFVVLWVPEERIALAVTLDYDDGGPAIRWWGNVDHPRDFEHFFTPLRPPLVELLGYVGYRATCDDCGTPLDEQSRELTRNLALVQGHLIPYSYTCEACYQVYGGGDLVKIPPGS
jgi:hypothetical protein